MRRKRQRTKNRKVRWRRVLAYVHAPFWDQFRVTKKLDLAL